MYIFFLILFTLFIASIIWLNYMGALNKLNFYQSRRPRQLIIFCEFVGQYKNIGTVFNNIRQNVKPNFFATDETIGIFYDDPSSVQDKNQCRAAAGLIIQEQERQKAEAFVREHPIFKVRELPELDCVSTSYPFRSMLSYLFIIGKVYPDLKSYAFKNDIVKKSSDIKAMMEIYHFDDVPPTIELVLPYGEDARKLLFIASPAPLYKVETNKKAD